MGSFYVLLYNRNFVPKYMYREIWVWSSPKLFAKIANDG